MSATYSQWIWGFELTDALGAQNNKLEFSRSGNNYTATLTPGVYTVDEFKTHIQDKMGTADGGNSYACDFNYLTLKFTIGGTNPFELLFGSGLGPSGLLGFAASNLTGSNSYLSTAAAGAGAPSTAGAWTATEPLVLTSPVQAQAPSTPALNTQRIIRIMQNVSDGGSVESIFLSTLRKVEISFRALASGEQTKMENLLTWAVMGKRLTWQPDKTSTNLLKLVLANPAQINNQFEWLARSEAGYGTLTFYEQPTA